MTSIIQPELEILLESARPVFETFLAASLASGSDVSKVESAMALAISGIRRCIVSSGLRVCVSRADGDYYCPAQNQ